MHVDISNEHTTTSTHLINRQELYRQAYRCLNTQWRDSLHLYLEVIEQSTTEQTRILDIGCGHTDFLRGVYRKTQHTYGIDPDEKALQKNTVIREKVVGTAEHLPYANNFFDLIVLAWVLEHLERPGQTFQEIYRTLKPGGKVIFLTPNSWNYNVWIIR